MQALEDEGRRLVHDGGAGGGVELRGALRLVLVESAAEQAADGESQAVRQGDTHDAHRRAAQAVRVARAARRIACDPGADDVVGLVGDGEQSAGEGRRHGRRRRQRQILLAHGARHRLGLARRPRVDLAHRPLQGRELDHHPADEVGLGERGGAPQRRRQRVFGRRAVAPGRRRRPGLGARRRPGSQTDGQTAQARRLVGERAELLVEDHGAEAAGHRRQPLGEVAVVGELGVGEAAVEHALVAARDGRGRGGVAVRDVEEDREQRVVG